MSRMQAAATRILDAEPAAVWDAITDFSGARPKMLPDNYQDYRVERGVDGTGIVLCYTLRAGGREREYRMQVRWSRRGRNYSNVILARLIRRAGR